MLRIANATPETYFYLHQELNQYVKEMT